MSRQPVLNRQDSVKTRDQVRDNELGTLRDTLLRSTLEA